MIKLKLLLGILFTNIFVLNSQYIKVLINLNNNYLDSVIITDDYRLDYYDDNYYLSNTINYLKLDGSNFSLVEHNNNAYLFYNSDNKYCLSIYNISLKELSKTIIEESQIKDSVVIENDDVIILYNFNDDIHLKTFDEVKIDKVFEGELKEEVIDFCYYDEYYYMLVKKDKLTGGDFGYGGSDGCKVLLKLDKDFKVINYNTINITSDVNYLKVTNDLIYLVFNNNDTKDIYLFDLDFKLLNKYNLTFEKIVIGDNDLALTINNEIINVYDNITFEQLYTDTVTGIKEVKDFKKFLYFKLGSDGYILDAINLSQFKNINFTSKYLDLLEDVKTLYGKATIVNNSYLEYYDENIFGTYHLEVEYKTSYDIPFLINSDVIIENEVNVIDGLIYPSGYRLDYNGYGELDNINIVNNYPVNKEGKHTLILKGVNTNDKIVTFYVSNDQIDFSNKAASNGIELDQGEDLFLEYDIDQDLDIKDVIISGGILKKYTFDNKKLKLTIGEFDNDNNEVFIKYIEYEIKLGDKPILRKLYINDTYNVITRKQVPEVSLLEVDSDYNFRYEVIDYDSTIRGIELLISNDTNNYQLYYPLKKAKIMINDLPKGVYNITVNLIYQESASDLNSVELIKVNVNIDDSIYFGDITLNSKNDTFTRFSVSLSKDVIKKELTKVSVETNDIYYHTKKNPLKIIIASIIFSIIGFFVTFLIIRLIRKRKNKRFA